MVEDVTTSGKSIGRNLSADYFGCVIEVVGLIVSLNRMEVKGKAKLCAQEVSERWGMPTQLACSMDGLPRPSPTTR